MLNKSTLILAAGMPRSGSTWLYNAARLLLSSSPLIRQEFSYGWIGDWEDIPKKKFMLIKAHDYDNSLVEKSTCILYSYRDIRDALASSHRKFGRTPSMALADNYINENEKWEHVANYLMHYETMLHNKSEILSQLTCALGLDNVEISKIICEIEKLNYNSPGPKNDNYHLDNLYHRYHITDGRHGTWEDSVNAELIKKIEVKHKKWFEKHGYTTDHNKQTK